VQHLDSGVYRFELTVQDNGGLTAKDTLQVTVIKNGSENRPPVALAGKDTTVFLPADTAVLDGSLSWDPDNNITGYSWTKISGPASFTIVNTNVVQTLGINLTEGIYQFELTVTDAAGLSGKDTLQVTVLNRPTPCTDCRIVFVSSRDGNEEIYTCKADGSGIQRLTNNAAHDYDPAWSPDGTRIAFISDRTGYPELFIMNADGSNVIRKTFAVMNNDIGEPAWSPDGTKIAYTMNSNGSMNIWVVDLLSGTSSLLFQSPGWEAQPAWSPDGTKIALASDWAFYDTVWDIFSINADGTGFKAVTHSLSDFKNYMSPSWSPDGRKLALVINQWSSNTYQVGVINPDGSGLVALKSGAAEFAKTVWSGDGTRILYTSFSGSGLDISWVAADGSASGIIVTNGWDADWQR